MWPASTTCTRNRSSSPKDNCFSRLQGVLMSSLIPPHGGLSEPVNRQVPDSEVPEFRKQAASWKKVPVSDADLSSLCRMGDGGLSPLTGPMDGATWNRVLDEEVLLHNSKPYAWTIP